MTDLVDRLHADADAWDPHAPETAQLEREAAAEIERLTANLSHHIDAKAQLTFSFSASDAFLKKDARGDTRGKMRPREAGLVILHSPKTGVSQSGALTRLTSQNPHQSVPFHQDKCDICPCEEY